jgi:predicted  nucleic acid-binding Zn-ribbon protein
MNPDLEKLVRLHRAESEMKRVESELAGVPRLRQQLEARVAGERARLEAARTALEASQKARKHHEAAVQDLETQRSKYKSQLMDVKTNKEYTAMLHEIEAVERDIRTREDQILEEMERAESLAQDVKREEAAFKGVEGETKVERAEVDAREARLTAEATRAAAERDEAEAAVPEEALRRYQRVLKLRGTGVSEARDGICQTCHVKVRLQVWAEIRRNETLIECDSCSRILYYEPPPPTVAVEP